MKLNIDLYKIAQKPKIWTFVVLSFFLKT